MADTPVSMSNMTVEQALEWIEKPPYHNPHYEAAAGDILAAEVRRLHARVRELEAELESWKRQSRANWEAARALATTATGYPRALSEHEQAAMDALKESP